MFKFDNVGFDLLYENQDDIFVKVQRRIRRVPFPGMKQPTPRGGMLGTEVILEVRHAGLRARNCRYALLCDNFIIQAGITDEHGMVYGLPVAPESAGLTTYVLNVDAPLEPVA